MNVQRVGLTALRGSARSNALVNQNVFKAVLATRQVSQQSHSHGAPKSSLAQGNDILVKQRLNRPISPHLGIYKLEQTWFSHSAWTRITGVTLSGTAYLYFCAYTMAPLLGVPVDSAAVASAFASLPAAAQATVKFALGFPFAYHFLNGTRHLVFDFGIGFQKANFKRAEAITWSLSILGGLALAFLF